MDPLHLLPLHGAAREPDTPAKVRDAAQQFEALLIGQILKMVHESGGWMGESDSSSDCAMDYAEQQLALTMARQGGLGLADLIARGLDKAQANQRDSAAAPGP